MSLKASGYYDKKYQECMVAHVLRSKRMIEAMIAGQISPNDFDLNIHKSIITAAIEVLQTMGSTEMVPLTALMVPLRLMITADIVKVDEVPALKVALANMYSMELAPNYYEKGLREFLKQQRVLRAYNTASIGDIDGLQANLENAIASSSFGIGVTHKPLLDVQLGEPEIPVPCGISSIDQRMKGGLGLKRSMLICAFTGMGKTALAINFALASALQGFPSRIVQTELPKEEMNQRMLSCAARYSYDLVQFSDADEDDILGLGTEFDPGISRDQIRRIIQERLARIPARLLGNYGLYDFSEKTCTIQLIADELHRDQDLNPENPPRVLDVDWLECIDLPPTNNREKQIQSIKIQDLRHKLEKTSELFTRLCVNENVAGRMYTQSDFAAEGKSVVKMSNKSEGKGASRRYSWFLGAGASDDELKRNILTITAGKARNGRLFSTKIKRALHEQRFEDMAAHQEWVEIDNVMRELDGNQFAPIINSTL